MKTGNKGMRGLSGITRGNRKPEKQNLSTTSKSKSLKQNLLQLP